MIRVDKLQPTSIQS